ncbi:hypothetical protein llap_983 [Limosa lapponica baueri]|uniref:Uncharacterized protein n=1 Tax=Limosa lapponica baueri TaxID=1758121 RepID=A0A2I0URI8_LIMLA|nr:hypothetical protein llap_983 [Limosa lapponica baueri]
MGKSRCVRVEGSSPESKPRDQSCTCNYKHTGFNTVQKHLHSSTQHRNTHHQHPPIFHYDVTTPQGKAKETAIADGGEMIFHISKSDQSMKKLERNYRSLEVDPGYEKVGIPEGFPKQGLSVPVLCCCPLTRQLPLHCHVMLPSDRATSPPKSKDHQAFNCNFSSLPT